MALNIPVEITVDAPQQCRDLIGLSANIKIVYDRNQSVQIPLSAVSQENGQAFVQQIIENQLIKKKVQTGATTKTHIIITQGLQVGEHVVEKNYNPKKY